MKEEKDVSRSPAQDGAPASPQPHAANGAGRDARSASPALAGIRVLDLTAVIMGPTCTQVLADHGADVVKVEPPEGDMMRHAGAKREPSMGSMFVHVNRGKRSVVLDLKTAEDRALLLQRIREFDVVVHNMRSDAVVRLGFDYETVARLHPGVIYVELSGYGLNGPYADRPAFDDIIQAQTGIASLLSAFSPDGPRYLPALIADRLTGMNAAQQVLAALVRRERTGEGCYLNVAMFETMAAFVLADHLGGRSFEPQAGALGYSRLLTPHRRPYRTLDGHIAAVVYTDRHWRSFFDVIGRPDIFAADTRFASAAARAENYDVIYGYIAEVFTGADSAYWLKALAAADIPCAPVNDLEALIADPHLAAVGFFSTCDDGRGATLRLMVPPGASPPNPHAPPRLGQHTREFLEETSEDAPAAAPAL